jgi:hypothetical protein
MAYCMTLGDHDPSNNRLERLARRGRYPAVAPGGRRGVSCSSLRDARSSSRAWRSRFAEAWRYQP